jgi:hypothetical protein
MTESHSFVVRIDRRQRPQQRPFRWTILEAGKIRYFSTETFETIAQAEADAESKLAEVLERGRADRPPSTKPE